MEAIFKLTTRDGKTRLGMSNETQWAAGTTHTAPGGKLCTAGVIHAYRTALIAAFMDSAHGRYGDDALLWECEGEVCVDDGTKLGCTSLTTLRVIDKPVISRKISIRAAIYCAQAVMPADEWPAWHAWAARWLSGEDRAAEAVAVVAAAVAAEAAAVAEAWKVAAWAAEAAASWMEWAVAVARTAEEVADAASSIFDLHAIIVKAIADEEAMRK